MDKTYTQAENLLKDILKDKIASLNDRADLREVLSYSRMAIAWASGDTTPELTSKFVLNFETKVMALADAYERLVSHEERKPRGDYDFKSLCIDLFKQKIDSMDLSSSQMKLYENTLLWIDGKVPFATQVDLMSKYEDYVEALADVMEQGRASKLSM